MTIIYDFLREHCPKATMFDIQISVSRTRQPSTVFLTSAFLGSSYLPADPSWSPLLNYPSTCHLHLASNHASNSEFGPGPASIFCLPPQVRSSRMLVELCRLPLETPAPTSPLSTRPAQLMAYLTSSSGCLHGNSKSA